MTPAELETACCPDDPVPVLLYATITDKTGTCVSFPDEAVYAWDGSNWVPNFDITTLPPGSEPGTVYNNRLYFACDGADWKIYNADDQLPVGSSCGPFAAVWAVVLGSGNSCTLSVSEAPP